MTKIQTYVYQSKLAPFINAIISEKRILNYIYNREALLYKHFDTYWIEHGNKEPGFSREDLEEWLAKKTTEGASHYNRRIGIVRTLAIHLNLSGYLSYIPSEHCNDTRPIVHVFSHDEIEELFHVIDSYNCTSINDDVNRLAKEYPILFRLLYCCGLRIGEAIDLSIENVDFNSGAMTILDGKGHKDRIVYMSEDLRTAVCSYQKYIEKWTGGTLWLFPGRNKDQHISRAGVERRFNSFWSLTEASKTCDKKPTPHCFRHTYIVDRINSWAINEKEYDIKVLIQYLRKSLGHATTENTFYYYHLVEEAFEIIHERDTWGDRVIPEVKRR